MISSSNDGTLVIWDSETAQEVQRLAEPGTPIHDLVCSRNGQYVFTAKHDGSVTQWRLPERLPEAEHKPDRPPLRRRAKQAANELLSGGAGTDLLGSK